MDRQTDGGRPELEIPRERERERVREKARWIVGYILDSDFLRGRKKLSLGENPGA